jgi:hypothetical protein
MNRREVKANDGKEEQLEETDLQECKEKIVNRESSAANSNFQVILASCQSHSSVEGNSSVRVNEGKCHRDFVSSSRICLDDYYSCGNPLILFFWIQAYFGS